MVLSATAVAAVGAVGVWMGLAATSVPTVDLGPTMNDTVTVSTSTEDAAIAVEWRLRRDGTVAITASTVAPPLARPGDFPSAISADIAIQLSCDARLKDPELPDGVTMTTDGSEAECGTGAPGESIPARQIFQMTVGEELYEIAGRPVTNWSTSLAGQTTARSPRVVFLVGNVVDEALPGIADPGRYSALSVVLEAGPNDLLDLTVTPAGDVVEATSVGVQDDGEHTWVDSVTWAFSFERFDLQTSLEEGLARWTDPAGQTFMQLLLLLSGALIGVAASLGVEALYSWTLRVRGTPRGE